MTMLTPAICCGRFARAVARLANGDAEVVLFRSSMQIDRLFEIARSLGIAGQVRRALAERVVIASVGPVMTASL